MVEPPGNIIVEQIDGFQNDENVDFFEIIGDQDILQFGEIANDSRKTVYQGILLFMSLF